jgi:stalled ribosome rescue protein Dom34
MMKQVGLWIDHRKAVIVAIVKGGEDIKVIKSSMEKHVRFSSGGDPYGSNSSMGPTSEDSRDRKFENHLDNYYKEILSIIHEADSIWIFGPGEAKVELSNYLKKHSACGHILSVEPVDKLTDRQIASKVRDYYKRPVV